ncbi:hypothetical protein F5Y14DRAFT_400611 [Nemania sp. NC0429]|nr:hypothetical protein F5Y14DRAFT_400611 [Nemania sp. NC0429]
MVGVPGRSKACSTCRRRKKGCDSKRPACTQCLKAELECGGYEREMVFLNHTKGAKLRDLPVYRRGLGHTSGGVTDVVLPNGLAQTAYVEKYISIFLNKYLPAGRAPTADRLGPSRDWIEIAHELYTSDQGIQFALLSLGLFAAGESQYAIQSHCHALRKLQTALCIPSRVQNDSTLVACQLLGLVEVFHGADGNADGNELLQASRWHSHLSGLLALICSRSPDAYQSGAGHQLFTYGRYILLVWALKDRQRFALNTPKWRTIPWEKEPKSYMDKLHDIMADLAEILVDTDEMRYCDDPVQKADMRRRVLVSCQCLDKSLQDWLEEAGPLASFHDDNGRLIEPPGPSHLLLAHMTLWYWTIYVILYSTIISIHEPPLTEIPADIDPKPYIQSVANALPYFWRPGARLCGANMASSLWGFCLHITYASPHRYAAEIAQLEQFALQKNLASSVMQFLSSLHRATGGPLLANISGRKGMILRAQSWMMGNVSSIDQFPRR